MHPQLSVIIFSYPILALKEGDSSPSLCNREDRLHFRPGTWFTLFESGHSGPTYESIA